MIRRSSGGARGHARGPSVASRCYTRPRLCDAGLHPRADSEGVGHSHLSTARRALRIAAVRECIARSPARYIRLPRTRCADHELALLGAGYSGGDSVLYRRAGRRGRRVADAHPPRRGGSRRGEATGVVASSATLAVQRPEWPFGAGAS